MTQFISVTDKIDILKRYIEDGELEREVVLQQIPFMSTFRLVYTMNTTVIVPF